MVGLAIVLGLNLGLLALVNSFWALLALNLVLCLGSLAGRDR